MLRNNSAVQCSTDLQRYANSYLRHLDTVYGLRWVEQAVVFSPATQENVFVSEANRSNSRKHTYTDTNQTSYKHFSKYKYRYKSDRFQALQQI
jgi:hypothetical protein